MRAVDIQASAQAVETALGLPEITLRVVEEMRKVR